MSDTEQKPEVKRRWSGFVCPACRFVFRIPRDHDGKGVVCPSCRRMLRIPGEGDETAPLMTAIQKIEFSRDEVVEEPLAEKRRQRRGGKSEKKPDKGGSKLWGILKSIVLIVGALSLIALVTVFLVEEIYYSEEQQIAPAVEDLGEVESFDDLIAVPLVPRGE